MEAAARQSRPRRADLEARADGQLGSSVRSLAPNGSRDSVGRPVRPPGKIRAEKSVRLRSVRSGADYRDGVRWAILACAKVVPSRRSARSARKSEVPADEAPALQHRPLFGIERRGEERPFLIEVAEARPGGGGEKPADHPLESGDRARRVLRSRTLARPETHRLPGFVPGDEVNLHGFAAHPRSGPVAARQVRHREVRTSPTRGLLAGVPHEPFEGEPLQRLQSAKESPMGGSARRGLLGRRWRDRGSEAGRVA